MRVQITRFQTSFIRFKFLFSVLFFLDVLVRTCVLPHRCAAIAVVDGDGGGGGGDCGDLFIAMQTKSRANMLTSFANTFRND